MIELLGGCIAKQKETAKDLEGKEELAQYRNRAKGAQDNVNKMCSQIAAELETILTTDRQPTIGECYYTLSAQEIKKVEDIQKNLKIQRTQQLMAEDRRLAANTYSTSEIDAASAQAVLNSAGKFAFNELKEIFDNAKKVEV